MAVSKYSLLRNLLLDLMNHNFLKIQSVHTTHPLDAGHSKWANIKHIKAQKDGQKSLLFTKMSRLIRLAIQEGGSVDPNLNTQLRSAVDNALRKNMPLSTIQNTIKKCQAKLELKNYRLDIRYKRKVCIICTIYTDNFVGTKSDATALVKKSGGLFVDVGHMFEEFGLVEANYNLSRLLPGENLENRALEDAIKCGAEDIEILNGKSGVINFICSPDNLNRLRGALEKQGYEIENMEHVYTPKNAVILDSTELKTYEQFVEKLRYIHGVESIYDNVKNYC